MARTVRTTAPSPKATIERLYAALGRCDGDAMAACYAPDATFSDPVFVGLRGAEVGQMWKMLTAGAKDLIVTLSGVVVEGETGRATVEARYTFSKTGRPVRNVIASTFSFKGALIATQVDRFPFWRWSRQALGPVGLLLGWTPLVKSKVRSDARRRLASFDAGRAKAKKGR